VSTFPTNPALEAAIVANANEDTPRLAYADWLDENGDPDRAEFIRVQCRLADMPPSDPDWVDLTERQSELDCRLKHRFLTRVGEDADRFDFGTELVGQLEEPFRRGFPYTITCQSEGDEWTADEVTRVASELTRLVRTTTLRAFQACPAPPGRLRDLLKAPVFAELTGLTVHPLARGRGEAADLPGFYRFLASATRRVERLFLYYALSPEAVAALAKAKFPALRRLTVNEIPEPDGVKQLTKAAWFRRLRHLRCGLEDSLVAGAVLTALGELPELHTLDLLKFAPLAVGAFARGEFPSLARLVYSGPSGKAFIRRLAVGKFPSLTAFEMTDRGMDNDGLAELLKADWFERLRVLDLSHNDITDRGLKALALHPVAKRLRVLKLGDNKFGKGGLDALAAPGAFPELTTLSLRSFHKRKVAPGDVTKWLQTLRLPRLRHLDLQNWPLSNTGAKALAANPTFAGLTRLDLGSCIIGDAGMKALLASPHSQNLVELQLSGNAIKTGAAALADPAVLSQLGECWLDGNNIPQKARAKLERDGLYLIT
jgi:uncharacterized protein (TIGR02996 family)